MILNDLIITAKNTGLQLQNVINANCVVTPQDGTYANRPDILLSFRTDLNSNSISYIIPASYLNVINASGIDVKLNVLLSDGSRYSAQTTVLTPFASVSEDITFSESGGGGQGGSSDVAIIYRYIGDTLYRDGNEVDNDDLLTNAANGKDITIFADYNGVTRPYRLVHVDYDMMSMGYVASFVTSQYPSIFQSYGYVLNVYSGQILMYQMDYYIPYFSNMDGKYHTKGDDGDTHAIGVWQGTQDQYDALGAYDNDIIYLINE